MTDGGSSAGRPLTVGAAIIDYMSIGGNFLGFRVAVETVPPLLATACRALVGGFLLLAIWAAVRRLRQAEPGGRISSRQLRAIAIQSTLLLVCGQGSVAWSLQALPAGTTAILSSSMPIWIAILSTVWLHQPLSRTGIAGVLIGFAGLAALAMTRDAGVALSGPTLVPALVTLGGAISTAAGVLYGQRAKAPRDALLGSALQMICAGLIVGCLAPAIGELDAFTPSALSSRSWLAMGYLIVFGSVVGYSVLVWLTEHAPPALAASFAYVGPVVALILSAWLLDEPIGAGKIAAAFLALVGAALMSWRQRGAEAGRSKGAAAPPRSAAEAA